MPRQNLDTSEDAKNEVFGCILHGARAYRILLWSLTPWKLKMLKTSLESETAMPRREISTPGGSHPATPRGKALSSLGVRPSHP